MTIIDKLKDAAKAYRAACEFDYCPEPKEHKSVVKHLGPIKKSTLEEWRGNRPDEIVNGIIRLIEQLGEVE